MCNPIENLCDKIEAHVAGRERELIERLRNALGNLLSVTKDWRLPRESCRRQDIYETACEAFDAADAWLAESVEITVQPEYGSVK